MLTATLLTYDDALELLKSGRNGTRKVGNNTWLRPHDNAFAVQLHRTNVVVIRKDGNYVLNSGGYRTATTKQRINTYSPASVCQDKGKWYLFDRTTRQRVPFVDGMMVDSDGTLIGSPNVPDINELLKQQDVSSKYGAPMGRPNQVQGDPSDMLFIQRVEFVDECYDAGGAYWGCPENLWCAFTDPDRTTDDEPVVMFVRANNQDHAKQQALDLLLEEGWEFYEPV
jgi:hypothetical protein